MAFDYANILDNVSAPAIDEFGDDVTLRVMEEATGSDEWDPDLVSTDFAARAVRTKFKRMEIDGTVIEHGDVLYLVAPTADLPEVTLVDKLVDGPTVYTVINIETVKTGPLAVLWKIQCRK
jgi:hypothetical protein